MNPTTQAKLLTGDDLLAMGKDCHCELVEGRLVEMSPTNPQHGGSAMRFGLRIGNYVDDHELGSTYAAETGFRLKRDPDTVRAPDFAFVARERITPDMDPTHFYDLAPDLVVEVVSPSDRASAVARKVKEYLEAGTRLVLVAYPRPRRLAVHRANGSSQTLQADDVFSGEDVLPGFTCRVADFFPQ